MDICEHCHNVLAKSIDRCTVCGTLRADPLAADVRRRDTGASPAHAPGWAAPQVEDGLHPEEFLRELIGESSPEADPPPVLPPRATVTPPTGALAGYLGTTVERGADGLEATIPAPEHQSEPPPPLPPEAATPAADSPPPPGPSPDERLTTATKLTADGVAARSTRLDGSVKIGPTANHSVLSLGAPVLAGVILVATVLTSYRVTTSTAASEPEAEQTVAIDTPAVAQTGSAVVRLDLDGCGIVDQTTGFLFANQSILVPRSAVMTDDRPTVITDDGNSFPAEIVGWSLTRDLAVIRADQRLSSGLRWGVSNRSSVGDPVSVLAVTGPGAATPVPAVIESVDTTNGFVTGFALDITPAHGSIVLNTNGFVIGIIDGAGRALVSDDLSPAVSRIVLADERPPAECPPPPPTTVPTDQASTDGTTDDTSSTD
jgi:S1-C subfamily serine protease